MVIILITVIIGVITPLTVIGLSAAFYSPSWMNFTKFPMASPWLVSIK
jgi:hypothetical protein